MSQTDLVMKFIETFEGLRRYKRWSPRSTTQVRHNEMMLLMFLDHNLKEGVPGIQPSELGELLRMTRPTITAVVNSLEEKGYVVRINAENDRRVIYVKPTLAGTGLVKNARRNFAQGISELIDYLGEADSEELIRIMGKIRLYLELKQEEKDRSMDSCGD